jgi:hypothetical protein
MALALALRVSLELYGTGGSQRDDVESIVGRQMKSIALIAPGDAREAVSGLFCVYHLPRWSRVAMAKPCATKPCAS